jgi:hypothetical protein
VGGRDEEGFHLCPEGWSVNLVVTMSRPSYFKKLKCDLHTVE